VSGCVRDLLVDTGLLCLQRTRICSKSMLIGRASILLSLPLYLLCSSTYCGTNGIQCQLLYFLLR